MNVSYLLKSHPKVTEHVQAIPTNAVCISAITEGELQFGLAKRPEAKRLHLVVKEFLQRVDVLPWNKNVAKCYGKIRVTLENEGIGIGLLDLLIASHALEQGLILVTNDKAFRQITGLVVEDWTLSS